MKLTAKTVAALELPPGKTDVIHFDGAMPGFGYRLRAGSGGKVLRSWVAQYRHAGRTRRLLLGSAEVLTADSAREKAKATLAAVALGNDPQGERVDRRAKDLHSLSSVVEEYLAAREPKLRPKTRAGIRRYLAKKYFKPLHAMPVDTITRKDIAARLVVITRESSEITAGHARDTLSAFFTWAMQMGYVEQNPVVGTIRPKKSEGRSRVLTDAELAAIWRACEDDEHGRIVRLLILTGCRRQEAGGMRWSEFDDERGTWTLPALRAKNKHAHTLPLPAAAWDIIRGVPRRASRDQLFGDRAERGFVCWGAAKADLDKKLGTSVEPFVLHDIRRSFATKLADLGVQPHIIEQILNHQGGHKRGVAGTYNRSVYDREVRAALLMWADQVRALVEGSERVVHMLPHDVNHVPAADIDVPRDAT